MKIELAEEKVEEMFSLREWMDKHMDKNDKDVE